MSKKKKPSPIDPSKMGKKGGKARARALSPQERSAIAREGAAARWENADHSALPRAICGGDESPLVLGGVEIPCYVLEDERRVITLTGLQTALGLGAGGSTTRLADFVARIDPNSTSANELAVRLESPIQFRSRRGKPPYGFEVTILQDICESILAARQADRLTPSQQAIAKRAEILVRGWARVGLIALVDEVTGFQYIRPRRTLQEILEKYIAKEIMSWTKTFPDEFYIQLFRLKEWDYKNLRPGSDKPGVVGYYTKNIVYQRMMPGVIEELERLNPTVSPGRRASKHHQLLTRDIGHAELREHLTKVVTLMQASDNWDEFRSKLRRVLPMRWEQFRFEDLFPSTGEEMPKDLDDDGLDV